MKAMGLEQSQIDYCVFVKKTDDGTPTLIASCHIDETQLAGTFNFFPGSRKVYVLVFVLKSLNRLLSILVYGMNCYLAMKESPI